MEFLSISVWVSLLLCSAYVYIRRKYNYWQRNQIPFIKPKFPFGNLKLTKKDEHISEKLTAFLRQRKSNTPIVGLYFFLKPVAFVVDLDLIRKILIKDFNHFENRATIYDKDTTPLSANLFNLQNDEWKSLRKKITSTFTASKMKLMFPTIVTVANELVRCISTTIQTDSVVHVSEWLARFSTDIIGNCAFGVDCNCLKDPHALFREMGKKIFSKPKITVIQRLLMMPFRNAAKPILSLFGINLHHKDVTDFFMGVVGETVEYREQNQVKRNDFMDLMISLKNSDNEFEQLTVNEIAAQAFLFWVAGFETTSTALAYCLYELALDNHKHIQHEARTEIETILKKYDGHLTYEALNQMTYISQIVNETLRIHPPATFITRKTTQNYKVPNTNFTMPKGMEVFISVYDIHMDPNIYKHPKEFSPERFSQEKAKSSCTFIPFGDGPRACIGYRFGILQVRIALVKLLQQFEFSTCSKTQIPIKYNPARLLLAPIDGIWLKVAEI